MRRAVKIALISLAAGSALLLALAWLGLEVLAYGLCANEVQAEVLSPGRRLKAVVFDRDCGATTASTRQVSIIRPSDSVTDFPRRSGNVAVFPETNVWVEWKSDTELVVHAPYALSQEFVETRVRGVTIRCPDLRR